MVEETVVKEENSVCSLEVLRRRQMCSWWWRRGEKIG